MSLSDSGTKLGHLCKAFAFHTALQSIERTPQKRACEKGGGCPSEGAVLKAIPRCQDKDSCRGKAENKPGGRPQAYIMAQKRRMAEAAMSLKRNIVRPTPATVRADDRI